MTKPSDRTAGPEPVAFIDQALWRQFGQAPDGAAFHRSWLTLLCRQIPGARSAVLVLGEPDLGPFAPAASWPEARGGSPALAALVERCLAARRGMAVEEEDGTQGVAWPLLVGEHLLGAVAVELEGQRDAQRLQETLHRLQWGAGWVLARFHQGQTAADEALRERLMGALDLLAATLEPSRFATAAQTLVSELAQQLRCERVSLGLRRRGHVRVCALSHSAQVGKAMALVRSLGRLMDEAVDQRAPLALPPAGERPLILREHEDFARREGVGALLTLPLYRQEEPMGALVLERERPFTEAEREFAHAVAALTGPLLAEKRANDRPLAVKALVALREQGVRLFGPRHYLRKTVALVLVAAAVFLTTAHDMYRVTADTVIEGAVQRMIVAPLDGYLADCFARAGDRVAAGAPICVLDDRDLRLERLKWSGQRAQLLKQRDEARAQGDRAQLNVIRAQIQQADAQLALLDEQLERTRITAPFDGLLISGDLSQRLGGAVQRGEVLFEIAPLVDYRVILRVDEHDIGAVAQGQSGTLVLASMPEAPLAFTVRRIVPVAEAADGRNYFPVEAELARPPARALRPGMEGVGKIEVEERPLWWIWSHQLVDRLRLWWWRWQP